MDLSVNRSEELLHKKFGLRENLVGSENRSCSTTPPECV